MDQELFTPSEAVKYLAEKRGLHLTVAALRQRRRRKTAKALKVADRVSLWTKEELDAISLNTKPGRPRKDGDKGEEQAA
jgi:hypothetical protein